jgi:type II secretory pathway pseudopilin PulG
MHLTTKILPPSGLIESLTEEDRALFSSFGSFESAKPGKKIIHQGKPHGMLILILSGLLQAKSEDRGQTEILGSIHPGEWVGEINLFDPSSAVCSVEAVEPSEYWVITRDDFERFINKNHAAGSILLIGLAMTLSKRIRNLTEKHVVTSKAAKKPFLWVGLAVVSILAIAAIWNWVGELGLIKELRAEKRQGIVEVEQELEASKVKAKELELEVTRLEEELEWTKSEAEKKSPQRLTPPAQNAPENATPSAETKPLDEPSQPVAESVQEQTEPSQPVKTGPSESKPSLVSYPPEITLTKETMIPLTVNGKVSGSAKIAPGKEFKAVGVDGSDVLVAMAGSTVRIPKENSNFDEALDAANALAEEKAQAPKSAAPAPAAAKPPQTPSAPPVQQQAQQGDVQDASSESPAVQIEKIIKAVAPLKVLDSLKDFRKPGKESARTAFMRTEARKWEQAAETAKNCLRSQQMDQATTRILKNIVLAAEMFETARFEGIEAKLQEIDAGWLNLKTELEIYGSEGAPKPAQSQE